MPATTKHTLTGKQKRFITSRLMQISLLVDDYLYQQKPMSQKSAAAYITEISGYKDTCCKDVRSLQVIEKLNRCLNGIIDEQQELNDECVEEGRWVFPFQEMPNNNNEPILSPVYSTADEDLTQLISLELNDLLPEQSQKKATESYENNDEIETETTEVITESALTNSAIEEIGTDHNNVTGHYNVYPQAESTKPLHNNDMEVIDLCDDDIDQIISQNVLNYVPELNIQNAISNLSIRDLEEAFTPFTQDCSQSILNSFHPTYTCNNANAVRNDVASPLTHVTKTTIPRQKPATKIVTNSIIANVPTTNKKLNVHAPIAKTPITIHSTIVMQKAPKDKQKAKRITKKRNDKNKINTKSSKTIATDVSKTKIKQQKKTVKANIKPITNEVFNTTYAKEAQKNHSDYQAFNIKPSLTYSKTQAILKPITDNKLKRKDTLPIYNSTVLNDLSWIENIRFVREIASEEYESFTDEGFWENGTLPNNWNEGDFNY